MDPHQESLTQPEVNALLDALEGEIENAAIDQRLSGDVSYTRRRRKPVGHW